MEVCGGYILRSTNTITQAFKHPSPNWHQMIVFSGNMLMSIIYAICCLRSDIGWSLEVAAYPLALESGYNRSVNAEGIRMHAWVRKWVLRTVSRSLDSLAAKQGSTTLSCPENTQTLRIFGRWAWVRPLASLKLFPCTSIVKRVGHVPFLIAFTEMMLLLPSLYSICTKT